MDREILDLYDGNKAEQLAGLLDKLSQKELEHLVDLRAVRGRGDPVALIRAVFTGSPASSVDGLGRRTDVFKHCIKLLQNNDLSNKVSSELVGLLMLETDAFPARSQAELAAVFVEAIRSGGGTSGRSLELFPKVLSALAAQRTVVYGAKNMSGQEYKSHVLNSFCSGRWEPKNVIHLAAMFKDVPLTSEELKFVLDKLIRMLKELDLQEMPPLIYQLLLLSTKGHKKVVLDGITTFFVEQDRLHNNQKNSDNDMEELSETSGGSDSLRHVEGTVILHVTFAIKQDQELGREFVKCCKAGQQSDPQRVLAPFNLAMALSLARIHRFEEPIFDVLKSTILRSYKDAEKQHDSSWVREMAPLSCDIASFVLDTVRNSVYGWDHVTQGLVQLGFTLMDNFGPRMSFGKVVDNEANISVSPQQKACQLGAQILQETFKVHEMVRSEILEQILNRVVTKATAPVAHFIDLLSSVASAGLQVLLDGLPKVREAFDYLSFLPPATAAGLLTAIQPIMQVSMSLKDALILVLRKAMFSRQLEARKIAASGFLMILRNFKVLGGVTLSQASQSSFSLSQVQAQVDIHIPHNAASNEALCLEILGNLRRCLGQQADVRLTLYQGLYEVLCKNTQLSGPILTMLLGQLKRYYEGSEDVNPPVKLEQCILGQGDQVFLSEPLAHLLSCAVQCLLQADQLSGNPSDEDEDDSDGSTAELEDVLESLTRRMIKSEMEDFELDKSADFSMANSVGVRNNIFAILVLGVYEVLMEYNFTTGNYETNSTQAVMELYRNYQRLSDIVREKASGAAAGKKGRPTGGATASKNIPRSLLSLRFTSLLLKALFTDQTPSHQESLAVLRDSPEFGRYVLHVALQKLQQVNEKGFVEGVEGHNKDKIFKYCSNIARVMLKQYCADLQSSEEEQRDKGRSTILCLEGFSVAVHIMCTRLRARLPGFLAAVDRSRDSAGGDEPQVEEQDQIHKVIKKFQRMVMTVIAPDDGRNPKEAVLMLNVIGWLTRYLCVDGEQFTQVQGWVERVCTEQPGDDGNVAKTLMSLLFRLTAQLRNCCPLVRDMSQDIHTQLGDIDQEVEMEDRTHFALVNQRTAAPTVILSMLSHADRQLEDTEWLINRAKAELTTAEGLLDASQGPTQRDTQEKSVCTRLGNLVNATHELVQSAMPVGLCSEATLKFLTRLYGSLALLTKYYLAMYAARMGQVSRWYEKLVKLSGTNLTQFVYPMITYIQACQSENLQAVTEKSRKKDKKASTSAAASCKARVMKETRFIPNLIFAIEQYERYLIQLSKKAKIDFMEHMKLSTARDFRINAASLQDALEEEEEGEEEEEEDAGAQDQTNNEGSGSGSDGEEQENAPPNKRPRTAPPADAAKGKGKGKLGMGGRGKKGKTPS